MWMSKKIGLTADKEKAERGSVTLSSSQFETGGTVPNRNIENYSPYGYQSKTPVGEEVVVLPCENGQIMLGSLNNANDLESGEVRLVSKGGATILLKNDGSVVINSMVISRNGVVTNGN